MKCITQKRGLAAFLYRFIYCCLVIVSSVALGTSRADESAVPYQSTFDDYKATNKDTQTDWKSLDSSIATGEHQMSGMHHGTDQPMNHEAMGHNMSHGETYALEESKSEMPRMDHSKMKGMDHASSQPEKPAHYHDHAMMHHADMGQHDMQSMHHSNDETEEALAMPPAQHEPSDQQSAEEGHSEHTHQHSEFSQPETREPKPAFQIIPNLHPAIVHFPIALTIVAFLLGLTARVCRKSASATALAGAGNYALILAAVSAVAAVVFGLLAFNSTMNHDEAGHVAMLLHRAWAVPTAIGLVLVATWNSVRFCTDGLMSLPVLVCLAGLSISVATTAWLGAEVVYRHGIGVLSLPASGGHQHASTAESENPAEGVSHAH